MRFAYVPLVVALVGAGLAPGQTARQLYYEDEPPPPKVVPPQPPKQSADRTKIQKTTKTAKTEPKPQPPNPARTDPTPPAIDTPRPADPQFQLASTGAAPAKQIGLRYSLLRFDEDGKPYEVSPDSTFRSGDMVGVRVEVNRDGFLYVVSKGTSGNWKVQFPSQDIDNGDNRVMARRRVQLPSDEIGFVFDDQPGEEQLFVVYSSEPVREIESLIYSLREPERPDTKLLAQNLSVGNNLVANLRKAGSRDLITQRISKTSPPKDGNPENAVYIVSRNSGRVVADIRLTHK